MHLTTFTIHKEISIAINNKSKCNLSSWKKKTTEINKQFKGFEWTKHWNWSKIIFENNFSEKYLPGSWI